MGPGIIKAASTSCAASKRSQIGLTPALVPAPRTPSGGEIRGIFIVRKRFACIRDNGYIRNSENRKAVFQAFYGDGAQFAAPVGRQPQDPCIVLT